jgi:hypothetical protein
VKLRQAAAQWASRILAAILFALPMAMYQHRLDLRMLNWISSDPQAFLLHEQHLHSHPLGQLARSLFIFGLIYVAAVELLSWAIRKVAVYIESRIRSKPNQDPQGGKSVLSE